MSQRPTRTEGEPHDRSTRLADAAIKAVEASPEYNGEKVIVFLNDGQRCGLVTHGYEEDAEAVTDLFMYLRAMFRANGKDMRLYPFGEERRG